MKWKTFYKIHIDRKKSALHTRGVSCKGHIIKETNNQRQLFHFQLKTASVAYMVQTCDFWNPLVRLRNVNAMGKGQIIFAVHAKFIWMQVCRFMISTFWHLLYQPTMFTHTVNKRLPPLHLFWFVNDFALYDLFGLIHFLVERLVKWFSLPFLLTILVAYTAQRYHIFPAGMWCLHRSNRAWKKPS